MNNARRILTLAALTLSLAAAPTFAAGGGGHRSGLDSLRAQIMRLHVRLQQEAENSPEVIDAHKQACAAYTEMYKRREEVLTRLYQTDEYKDLRLALYHTQRKLAGVHEEIPVRVQRIMDTATDALAVRIQITQLEAATLAADPEFVAVRETANALNMAYRQARRAALEAIKSNPEFASLIDQLASAQSSVTGMRSMAKINRGG